MTPAVSLEKPDLFERIAQSLPAEQREEYWREIAYLKHLDPEDELLRLTRATGYLTQISQSVPLHIAEERERFEKLLRESVAAIETAHQATQAHYRQLNERLANLPTEIAKGISPEAIAVKITESVRQQFAQTGLPETAQALGVAAKQMKITVTEFDRTAGQLTHSYTGIAQQARSAIEQIDGSISRAVRSHGEAAHRFSAEFLQEYKRSLFVIASVAVFAGALLGFLLCWWIMPPSSESAASVPSAPVVQQMLEPQNTATSPNVPRKKHAITKGPPSANR